MIDAVDLQIIDILGNDGRMPVLAISKKLDLPNSTVRKRIKRLEKEGIIHFSCEVNPKKFPQILLMFVGIEARKNILDNMKISIIFPMCFMFREQQEGMTILPCSPRHREI